MNKAASGPQGQINVDENINRSTGYLYLVTLIAAVGGLLFGFDIGVISGAIPFIKEQFSLNVHQEGFVVGILFIGAIAGASVAGALSDKYGRKLILIYAAILFTIAAVFSGLPRNLFELIAARFACGIAVGLASVLSPVYIAEIAPAFIRGRLVSINQFAIVIGILITYFTNWLVVDVGPNNWRWMFAIAAAPSGLFFFALFFVPESPRWLTKKGKNVEALAILTRVGGKKNADFEMSEITENLKQEEGKLSELFKPGLRMALFVGVMLAVFQQFSGMNTIVYYAPEIFIRAGFETNSALLAQVLVGLVNFVFTIVAVIYMDKIGRKPLLVVGLIGMALSFFSTAYVYQSDTIGGKLVILPILCFVAFFCMSIGPATWVLLSEIFPTKIRGRAMAIATMSLWVACYILSQTFPWMINTFAGNSFYVYASICILALIFIIYMVPETKGKTLEEIENMWIHKAE